MSQIIVIKIGGVASQQLNQDFLKQLKEWKHVGHQMVIVHGGGFAINRLMKDNGIPIKKINNLRVTQKEEMPLVYHALVKQVGKHISQKLQQSDMDGVQLKAGLEKVVEAEFLDQENLGYVGQVSQIHPSLLQQMMQDELIPIVASIGYAKSGEMLNINADYLATAIAKSLSADKLILMTDVQGVLENHQVLPTLHIAEVPSKVTKGIITGGMIPKVESAVQTVIAGVRQVVIGQNLTSGTIIKG